MFGYLCCSSIRFTKAIDPQTIDVDLNQAILHQHDPFWSNISQNDRIGMLVIELASRRRLRINGTVSRIAPGAITTQWSRIRTVRNISKRHLPSRQRYSQLSSAREQGNPSL